MIRHTLCLSLLCTGSALAANPPLTNSHFQITKSFPVSEAIWAEKVGDLYLVASARPVLVYRKTGPGEADYQEVNRLFPGLDGTIENCAVAHGRLYVPASSQGLLAYRLADLEQSGIQSGLQTASPQLHHTITGHGSEGGSDTSALRRTRSRLAQSLGGHSGLVVSS